MKINQEQIKKIILEEISAVMEVGGGSGGSVAVQEPKKQNVDLQKEKIYNQYSQKLGKVEDSGLLTNDEFNFILDAIQTKLGLSRAQSPMSRAQSM